MEPITPNPKQPAPQTEPITPTPSTPQGVTPSVSAPTPETPAVPVPPVEIHSTAPHKDHLKAVRTLSSDVAGAVKQNQGSVIKTAIAEERRREQEKKDTSPTTPKNLIYIIGGLVLIAASAGIAGYYIIKNTQAPESIPVVEVKVAQSIVRSDTTTTLDLTNQTKAQIGKTIYATVAKKDVRDGTIKNILLTVTTEKKLARLPSHDFLAYIGAHASVPFQKKLVPDFMLGVYAYEGNHLFIVLRATAHDYMDDGMREWEPFLVQDLAGMFGIETQENKAVAVNTPFKDMLIENRDTRSVVDESGKPVLYYTFIDPDTVLIAASPKPLAEAFRRSQQ